MAIGRESPDLMKFGGKAKMFIEHIATGKRYDAGNLESFNLGLETENNSYETNEDDSGIPIFTKFRITNATAAFVTRTHSRIAKIIDNMADEEAFVQPAAVGETFTFDEPIKKGDVYELDAFNTSFPDDKFTVGTVEFVEGVHFRANHDVGMFKIVELPAAYAADTGDINFDQAEFNTQTYGAYSNAQGVLCRVILFETNQTGPRSKIVVHKVRFVRDGDATKIADGTDPLTVSATGTIEADETQPEGHEYYTETLLTPFS